MDLLRHLEADQRRIVEQVASLSRERFAQRAAHYDAESIFPKENYEDLRASGLLGLTVPKEYGGLGAGPLTQILCLLEIAKGCPATALTFTMHSTLLPFLGAMASEEQRQRYYADVVSNGKLFASITSEPESSFRDKFVVRTVFRPADGGYNVSGVKHFCSLGDAADYYFVSGMREGSTTARDGLLSALIPRGSPGVKVEGRWNATGMRGTVSHTIRYETFVKHSQVLGGPGQFLMLDLSGFALGYAATYLGIAEAAFEFVVQFARTKTFGPSPEPLSHYPMTQQAIGEMGTAIRAAKLLLCEAAQEKESGNRDAAVLAANQAKYLCAETGLMVTTRAMRLAGGRGILKDLPLERWHRDSLAGPVMPPANDRCLETVGKLLCGLKAATVEIQ